ncbi:hypothetical protein JCM3765_005607 [Sporobolomyces pararoseus]
MHLDHPAPCPPSCNHCLAFDNVTRATCSRTPSPRSKWCTVHEELQAKLLKTYKRYSLVVDSFDDSVLPADLKAIDSEEDLVQLRNWSEHCRQKWSLVRRVIIARAEHHQQFYAGGDWGHCLFVESLKSESLKLERFLRALDRQAYSINLAKSSASWILAEPRGPKFVCEDEPVPAIDHDENVSSHGLLTPPPTPPFAEQLLPSSPANSSLRSSTSNSMKKKNQRKAANRKAARTSGSSLQLDDDPFFTTLLSSSYPSASTSPADLLSNLRRYLQFPSDLPDSIRPETWRAVISSIFRHVILRIPVLANLAITTDETTQEEEEESNCGKKLQSVEGFLDLLESRLEAGGGSVEVQRLWQGLKFARKSPSVDGDRSGEEELDGLVGVGVIAEAISNLFRPPTEDSTAAGRGGIDVLGGRIWREESKQVWSREGWDLFYAFVACSGCALIATRSIEAWTTNRRLAALGHYPAWTSSSEAFGRTADKTFRLSGIVLCSSNSSQSGKKLKRVESKDKGKGVKGKKKIVYVEEMERNWMYCKLPINDPRSRLILDALSSEPQRFSVLARKTESNETTHTPTSESESVCSTVRRRCSCCKSSELWLTKVRSGFSPIERKSASWSTTAYFPTETVLSSFLLSSSPETQFHSEPYNDSYDCLILDSSPTQNDDWSSFAESVSQAVLSSQGFETASELTREERRKAIDRGEIAEGEWERLCSRAEAERNDGEGKKHKPSGGEGRKVVYVCEEELTARRMFRET